MGTLRARKDHVRFAWQGCGGDCRRTSMRWCRTSCIHPRRCSLRLQSRNTQGRGANAERMHQDTDPARLRRCLPVPLTLPTLWAAATIDDPGTVEHAQTAIGEALLLGWAQRLARRTGQRPVGLESEVLPREPIGDPAQGDRGLLIALDRRLLGCGLFEGGGA